MGRMILSSAAVCNATWVALLPFWPGTIRLKSTPLFEVLIAGIGRVGVASA